MSPTRKLTLLLLLGLALFGPVHCQDDDDYGGEGGGGDDYGGEDDEGGGGGGGEEDNDAGGGGQELTSLDQFDAFLDDEDASVIGAFPTKEMPDPKSVKPEGWDDEEDGEWSAETITTPQLAEFKRAASSMYNARFAWTVAPDVLAKLKVTKGGVFLYRSPKYVSKEHGDRPRERFPAESYTEATLSAWIKSKAQPLVGKWSYATKERYEKQKVLAIIFFNLDFEANAKGVAYVLKRARKAAAELKAKGVAVAVASSSDLSYELGDYGLEAKSQKSDILYGIKAGDAHYGASAAFSGPALLAFAESYLKGELEPYVRPPPPPYEGGGGDDEDDDSMGEGDEGDNNPYDGEGDEGGDEEKEEM